MLNMILKAYHYTTLAVAETFRIRQTLIPTTVIVIGMALPAALQLGFRDGLGSDLQRAITKSPKASELLIAGTSQNTALTRSDMQQMREHDSRIGLLIPEVTKVAQVVMPNQSAEAVTVTLLPTVSGDPFLKFHSTDVLCEDDRGIVLSTRLAEKLQIDPKSTLQKSIRIRLNREEDDGLHSYEADLPVRAVSDFANAPIAYIELGLMEQLEAFHQGEPLAEFNWPAMSRTTQVGHECYLAFSKTKFGLQDTMKLMAHGLKFEELADHVPERNLFGCLQQHQLHVYRIYAEATKAQTGAGLLTLSPTDVETFSDADDVVVPWSNPADGLLNDQSATFVGLTFRPRWLSRYLAEGVSVFGQDADELSVSVPQAAIPATSEMTLTIDNKLIVPVVAQNPKTAATAGTPANPVGSAFQSALGAFMSSLQGANSTPTPPPPLPSTSSGLAPVTAVVPAELLAHLKSAARGQCRFDDSVAQFRTSSHENKYFRARVIASEIHDVPELDAWFRQKGYAVISNTTQVQELRNHLSRIQLWSHVVIGTVGVLGFFTLIMTLLDNTQRKRRSIALLMSLGAGRLGICYVFLIRAVLISILAAMATVGLSIVAADALSQYGANCRISMDTLKIVCGVAIASCVFGALVSMIPLRSIDAASVANRADHF